jgi:hypothetical protein
MNNDLFNMLAKLDKIEHSLKESSAQMPVDEADIGKGNYFSGQLDAARKAGKKQADLDGDGDLEKVQYEDILKPTRTPDPKLPAYGRGKKLTLRDLGIEEPKPEPRKGPSPYPNYKNIEVPAYIRKQQGENFPAQVSEAQQLEECGMSDGNMPSEMDQDSKVNISSNYDSASGRKTLTVTADGESAEELGRLLKLSGFMGDGADREHPGSINVAGSMDAGGAEELADMLRNSGLRESYANEPDEEVQSTKKILDQGNDLNRKKSQHADKPKPGDNPLATEEVKESLEHRLWQEYLREKAR